VVWDETKARAATATFKEQLDQLRSDGELKGSEAIRLLQLAWKDAYPKCGHKRLGRLMVGDSLDQVNKVDRDG
jgi:hypothetical protein